MMKQVVFVVGGGSGIGVDVVWCMVEMGWDVGVMFFLGKGEVFGQEFGGFGFIGLNLVVVDFEVFVQKVEECFGWIDVVINCIGYGLKGLVEEIFDEDW